MLMRFPDFDGGAERCVWEKGNEQIRFYSQAEMFIERLPPHFIVVFDGIFVAIEGIDDLRHRERFLQEGFQPMPVILRMNGVVLR